MARLVPSGLRGRILLLLAGAFIAMQGVSIHFAFTERSRSLEEARARVLREAERVVLAQRDAVDGMRSLLALLTEAGGLPDLGPTPQCRQVLSALLKREPRLANLAFATPDGEVVCNATPTAFPVNVADRAYFRNALAAPDLVIGEAIVSRSTGKWGLPFGSAVRGDDGRVRGVVVAALDFQWLAAKLAGSQLPAGARVGLMSNDGLVLVRVPDPEGWVGQNRAETEFFKVLMAQGGTGTAEAPGWDSIRRVYGFARFAETQAGPIHLWVGVPRDAVVEDAERRFAWVLSSGLLVAALTLGLVWIALERLVMRPVAAMGDAARRLGAGDLGARTGLPDGGDELSALARSFDAMGQAIESRAAQLLASRAELESRAVALSHAQAAALNIMEDAVEARRRAEAGAEDLSRRTAELDLANKELEAFSYSVSHDLRAPLRSIDGFAMVLEEDYAGRLDEEGRDALRRVRGAAQRMGLLIDDLLQLSRLARADMTRTPVDLSALARAVAEELAAGDPMREVAFDIAPGVVAAGDRNLLKVVLENLLGNAWKFTGKGARARIEFGVAQEDGKAAYFVRDDGAGFDMAYAGKLFAPFQRLHAMTEFPGTGIGLATVRRIVRRHGGEVWAEGAVGKGATFHFTLEAGALEASTPLRETALA